jgi:crotonobetainyl-CoA:carnitine CoA-transferase CaiB-like acyl-CoA transferase
MENLTSVSSPPAGGPLAGVRVLDLSAYLAGPYGCTLLADMGAEVIKVEPPMGDNFRGYPSTLAAESRLFLGANRSKRAIGLDLKHPDGAAVLDRLIAEADVLVHNFRPSVPPRLNIAYDQLRARYPRLVYCAVSGYGESGPLKNKAGYDQVLQTYSGICNFQGGPGAAPELVLGSIVDYYSAAMVAQGVSAALFDRERTGAGRYVGVSLLRSALSMQSSRLIWADGEGRDVGRGGTPARGVIGLHPTRDGYLYLSATTPHFWRTLCERLGLPQLADDSRYDTVRKRVRLSDELVPQIRAVLITRSAREWERILGDDVPCAAERTIEDMFDDPQVLAEDMIVELEHPTIGHYRGFDKSIKFDGSAARPSFAAPVIGQHSSDILREIGYSEDDIDHLRGLGAVV